MRKRIWAIWLALLLCSAGVAMAAENDRLPAPFELRVRKTSALRRSETPAPAPETGGSVETALPLTGCIVGIDPGHQAKGNSEKEPVAPGSSETKAKVSSGTQGVSTRVPEYQVNLDIALLLRDALESQGATVVMTREVNEVNISNVERAQLLDAAGVQLTLRLHCNGSENRSVHGVSLFVKPDGTGAEESLRAAEILMETMTQATGARNAGVYQRDSYSGLNWADAPTVLVEMGFMSNPEEDEKLNDPEYQALLVAGMVEGVKAFFAEDAPAVQGE